MYALWSEGGTLFIGLAKDGLDNTTVEVSNDLDMLVEMGREMLDEDPGDFYHPGGLIILHARAA